jgi:hypothetical protein
MPETSGPPELHAFIRWLNAVVHDGQDIRRALAMQLGAGGRDRIEKDLRGSYLPDWPYVVATYLGPAQEITGTPLKSDFIAEGRRLHDVAATVAVPYTPVDRGHESLSRVVAPVLAGFSLPAIVSLATSSTPRQPAHDIALTLFVASTGCFLASLQLTIGWVYVRLYGPRWGAVRNTLTFTGIALLVAAVMVLTEAVARYSWPDLALAVLGLGGMTAIFAAGALSARDLVRAFIARWQGR